MAGTRGGRKIKSKSTPSTKRNPQNNLHRPTTTSTTTSATNTRQNVTQLITVAATATAAAHSFLTQNDIMLLPSQTLSLESNLSSTFNSLSKLISLLHYPLAFALPRQPPPPPCWFHRFLNLPISLETDARWIESFRMSKSSFTLLLRLLTPSLSSVSSSIPPNYALGSALYRLAHGASYKSVSRRFDLDDTQSACRAFYTVCKAINDKLGHLFEFRSDINRIVVGFGWISLPNCCGILGIDSFRVEGNLLGENGSIMAQALVDSEGRFLDVSAGWPSRTNPELILRQSELYSRIEESRELLNGPSFELGDGNAIPQYILGDSCFPLLPWLLTPFPNPDDDNSSLTFPEQVFNSIHSRGMELVGTAFAKLRVEWQILCRELKEEMIESFPFVLVTCCLLHNFLIKCSEELPEVNSCHSKDHELPAYEGEADEGAMRMREALALHLTREDA